MILTFAITGANGQVGSYLVDFLRKKGHVVYELVRSPDKSRDKNYYKFFDLSEFDKMPSLQGIDVLIHSAYFFDTSSRDYKKINVTGTQQLFHQAKNDQVKYSIFISSISAYENAISLYGKIKFHLETLLQSDSAHFCIVRPGLIFNIPLQGITATMDQFVKKYSVVPLIDNGQQVIYPCFLDDLSNLICTLSMKQFVCNKPIVAAAEQPITFKQLVRYLARKRNKSIFMLPVPFFGVYYLLKVVEKLKFNMGMRSDSLLGLQHANSNLDFSEIKKLKMEFKALEIEKWN